MTVTTNLVKQGVMGNGVTTSFNFTVPYIDPVDVKVYLKKTAGYTLLTKAKDYNIFLTPPAAQAVNLILGGTSIFIMAPPSGDEIWVIRESDFVQDFYDLNTNSPWPPVQTEEAFDRITLELQELKVSITGIVTPPSSLPIGSPNKYLKWDATGAFIINSPTDLDAYGTRITALESSMTTLQSTVSTHTSQISSLTTTINGHTSQITSINSQLTTINSTLGSHGSRITALETTVGGLTNQAAAISTLQSQVAALQSQMTAVQDKNTTQDSQIAALDQRLTEVEIRNYTFRRTGRFMLINPTYPSTLLTGVTFDYDFTTSSALNLEIRRSVLGETRVEMVKYSAAWISNQWTLTVVSSDFPTAPTGVTLTMTQNLADRSVQINFSAASALTGTYDPLNSWIAWVIEDMVRT